jgi:hypothetical protein
MAGHCGYLRSLYSFVATVVSDFGGPSAFGFLSFGPQISAFGFPAAAILKRLAEIAKTLLIHDAALREIYQQLRPLLEPSPAPPKPGGLASEGSTVVLPRPRIPSFSPWEVG